MARVRRVGDASALAQVPSGVLLWTAQSQLSVLPDGTEPVIVASGLQRQPVAVADDGERVTVIAGEGTRRRLQELAVPSGRVLRTVPVGPPLAASGEALHPVAYSGDAVLITVGEGRTRRAAVWESGDGSVVGTLDGFTEVAGGASAGRSDRATGGRGAFTLNDPDRCATAVVELRTGGRSWQLCRELFYGFSPDGSWVLASNAVGDGLVIRDARDGDLERELPVPEHVRASGWESDDTVLYTTVSGKGDTTVVVRCPVETRGCRTAATFPYSDRIPQPLRRFGH